MECGRLNSLTAGRQRRPHDLLGDAVDLMRTIKRAPDPKDLFNPGKIFSP
jgi:D-lactate dehydrogenase (cytochrome)